MKDSDSIGGNFVVLKVHMVTDPSAGQQALQQAPSEVRDYELDHLDKDTQDVFVGRHGEETRLLRLLEKNVGLRQETTHTRQPPTGQKAGLGGGKGIIITAPPGAGKSTLLDHVLGKAKQRGIGVIHINHESLATAGTLNEKIQSQEPWRSWIRERQFAHKRTSALAAGADSIVTTLLRTAGNLGGMHIDAGNVDVFTRLIDGWRQHETYATEELLQQIDLVYPNGFVFAIDEAQQLRRHLINDPTCASTVLNTLGAPNTRRAAGIAHGTIILAGLSDTEHVVGKFGPLRQQVIRLPPIRPDAVAELIEARIRQSERPEVECDAAVRAWGPPLVAEFGTWTHHAQCAAYAAQCVLGHFGREALDCDWGWPLVHRETLRGVRTLYHFVANRARQAVGTIHLQTVAHAMRANNNYIDNDILLDLIAFTEQDRVAGKPHPEKPTKEIVVQLLHAGLIDYASSPERTEDTIGGEPDLEGFRIGIPSVGTHLTATPPDAAMRKRIAACGLSTDSGEEVPPS